MASAKKLPSGSWRVNLYIGKTADGKRQYKSFTANTKKEAEYLAAQYNQLHIDVNRSEMPLKQAVEEYIKSKENVLSPSTVKGYNAVMNNCVQDLMALKLRDITVQDIQQAFNIMAKTHSPKYCRNAHGLISAVLKLHRPELTFHTALPPKKKKDIYVPDEKEVKSIAQLAVGTNIEIPLLLATQCGLRASEISGLELHHIHDDHIDIKQARVDGTGGAVLKAPKSYSGYRCVPIPPEIAEVLRQNADGNRIYNATSVVISKRWLHFRDKHKLSKHLNFHALRHHFASRCLLLGMPQKYIAEMMGHNSVDMIERVYQHTFPSAMEEYANLLRKQASEFYATRNATRK